MVVVAIMGIVMAAGIVAFSNTQKNARDAKRRADVDAASKALEQYYTTNGEYPYAAGNLSSATVAIGNYFPSGMTPVDPINNTTYVYQIRSMSQNYYGADGANPQTRFCVSAPLEKVNGNCAGQTGTGNTTGSFRCIFRTPGTGTHYCVQNRQ